MLKKLFMDLLKEPSITPDAKNCYEITSEFLKDFDCEIINKNEVSNQILSKTYNDNGIHIAFCGHIDVVCPGDGWSSDPFNPSESNGKITARGTQDMKGSVAAFLHAIKEFDKNAKHKNIKKLSVILTSDEEGDAIWGTSYVLECLKAKNKLPDIAIVAEPTCDKVFGDTIKVGRRGSIHASIKIKGKQGHVAYPSKCINPVHLGANALSKIAGYDLDLGNEFFEPSKIIITNLEAGLGASNVTPSEFNIKLNVRNSTLSDEAKLKSYLQECLKGCKYELSTNVSSKPFYTDANSDVVQAMIKAIEKCLKITPELNAKGGTSDARFLAEYGVRVCEFGVRNDKIHAVDESVEFSEIISLSECFLNFLNIINEENNAN